eukprot:scaffold229403_cov29-Tisochrysis_lutea.AAC.3
MAREALGGATLLGGVRSLPSVVLVAQGRSDGAGRAVIEDAIAAPPQMGSTQKSSGAPSSGIHRAAGNLMCNVVNFLSACSHAVPPTVWTASFTDARPTPSLRSREVGIDLSLQGRGSADVCKRPIDGALPSVACMAPRFARPRVGCLPSRRPRIRNRINPLGPRNEGLRALRFGQLPRSFPRLVGDGNMQHGG